MTRQEIKQQAKDGLRGYWGVGVIVTLIYFAISSALGFIPPLLIILMPPLIVGVSKMSLSAIRAESVDLENLFDGFKSFGVAVIASLLFTLIIIAWMIIPILLMFFLMAGGAAMQNPLMMAVAVPVFLISMIPAIIAQFNYALIYFIIADNPGITATEALKLSKTMMRGHRLAYFVFMLSFIGWVFLSMLTFFIGYLWLMPYFYVSTAGFYEQLKSDSPAPTSTSSLEF